MSAMIDILLPKIVTKNGSLLSKELKEWGGESFVQDPPRYVWNELHFIKYPLPIEYFENLIQKGIGIDYRRWEYLVVDKWDVYEFEKLLSSNEVVNKEKDIVRFFEEMIMQEEQWIVVLQHDDEGIEFAREFENSDIRDLMIKGLSHNSTTSFVLWHS